MTTSNIPLLQVQNLSRLYKSGDNTIRALDDVSLEIWPGEFVAIMGQSGSGKSTLMNILGCLDSATSGEYYIKGQRVLDYSPDALATLRRKTFGFVFQRYNLIATLSASENVEIPSIYAGLERAKRHSLAQKLLESLGIGARGDHRPSELSGGQQQRVAIARALVNDPPIILADEPTGALDSASGIEVINLLKSLNSLGRTIILITHEPKIAAYAQRTIRIADGKIVDQQENKSVPPAEAEKVTKTDGEENQTPPSKIAEEVSQAAKMAFRSLRVNLYRTMLTLLGIIIGVASVTVMLAVGAGSKEKVLAQISSMGTDLLSIRPGAPGLRGGGDIITLVPEDANQVTKSENVDSVVPERSARYTVRAGNLDYQTTIQGVGEAQERVREWPVKEGSFFTERDVKSFAPVVLLGQTVLKNLFPHGEDPIGTYVIIKNVPFEVIGTMTEKGASSWGNDQDDVVFIPYTTGNMRLFGKAYLNGITVKVSDVAKIDQTQKTLEDLIKVRHRTEDFSIRNMASLISMASETQNTLTILLGAVAAISLLVGGIGVMNIMLVSVTERTREIGIRMATGARKRDIALQFSTEAAVVGVIGGLMGIVLGLLVGVILTSFHIDVIFNLSPALLAFGCAVTTGLLFGYLPAKKAANMDPVVALASE